ncbi:CHASE3 domain-containing protein [Spirosoma pollinicola]|uniref:histidine kinase n=1 Tax=Spirosoma pollinicola TaxID=2057025 RepID=A0A2K8YS54_9BACT|nr:CHASE3 domain-containing protein [Spirosoma pollinicola]AUD00443.1 hypothetical protein CWM47_00575 [Spirosoma pollinicola]
MNLKQATNLLLLAFLLLLTSFSLISYTLWKSHERQELANDWVLHTREVITGLEVLRTLAVDAETGTRGYLLSRQPKSLEPYERARKQLPGQLRYLQRLVQDNLAQQRRLASVGVLIEQRLAISQQEIDQRKKGQGVLASQEEVEQGKPVMDKVRAQLTQLVRVEQQLLQTRLVRLNESIQRGENWLLTLLAVGLLMLVTTLVLGLILRQSRLREVQVRKVTQQLTEVLNQQRHQQAYLEGILNGSLNGLLSCAPIVDQDSQIVDLRIQLANQAASKINGRPVDKLVGTTLLTEFPSLAGTNTMTSYLQTARTGEVQRFETYFIGDGLNAWYEIVSSPLPEQNVLISFLDITDRKQAEAESLQQTNMLVRISESVHIGVATHEPIRDETGRIIDFQYTYSNDEVRSWLPADVPDLQNQTVRSLNFAGVGDQRIGWMANVVETGEPFRMDSTLDDGRVIFSVISRLDNGTVSTSMDVTQQRQAEENVRYNAELEKKVVDRTQALMITLGKLEESKNELIQALAVERELSELKVRFVAMASHEFRTPLTAVLTSAELIEKYSHSEQQEKRQKHTHRIRVAVKHLNAILEEFLSLGKLEEGQISVNLVHVDMSKLLGETVTYMQDALKPQQTIQTDLSCPDLLWLDASLLQKIMINLLSNAVKYSGPGSVVSLRAEYGDNELTITVQDQGIGMTVADQQRMFERFFRASNATNIEGTGLGLHIVRRYVDLMGGKISLSSELNLGTSVIVNLPSQRQLLP